MGKIGGAVALRFRGGIDFRRFRGRRGHLPDRGRRDSDSRGAGPLALSTEGGNIQVDRARIDVQAHTGAGVIEIAQAGGAVSADTRGGSIEVGSARGANCQSAAGTIRVKTLRGPLQIADRDGQHSGGAAVGRAYGKCVTGGGLG